MPIPKIVGRLNRVVTNRVTGLFAGRVPEAVARANKLHEWCMTQPQWAGDALAAAHVGWSALAAGRPRTAVRWLAEAVAGLGQCDPGGFKQLCTALLAQTHAQLGDAATAGIR